MASEKRYRTLTPTTVNKWKKGLVVEGTFRGTRESTNNKFEGKGYLLDLDLENGPAVYGCPTVLYNYLNQCEKGDDVRITCLGKIKVPRGSAWDFKVDVVDDSGDDEDMKDN